MVDLGDLIRQNPGMKSAAKERLLASFDGWARLANHEAISHDRSFEPFANLRALQTNKAALEFGLVVSVSRNRGGGGGHVAVDRWWV